MVKIFDNGKFRLKPWPMALFEDLEDEDELKRLLTIKMRVDRRIKHLIQASTLEIQCDLGTESLHSIPKSLQWPEFNSGQVSLPTRKTRSAPRSAINVLSFKGDKQVEKVETTRVRDTRLKDCLVRHIHNALNPAHINNSSVKDSSNLNSSVKDSR